MGPPPLLDVKVLTDREPTAAEKQEIERIVAFNAGPTEVIFKLISPTTP